MGTHGSDFNAGAGATIDSNKPFTFSQRFDVNGNDFTFTTTLSQEGRQHVMRMNPNHQMSNMLGELRKGMALVTGYWFADCGDDNTGWCHQSAANREICTGTFDASAP